MTLTDRLAHRMSHFRLQGARLWPGVLMCGIVAAAAMFLSDHYGAPGMLFALLLGMSVNFLSHHAPYQPGIDFVARQLLRAGVALLGLKMTAAQVQAIGWPAVIAVAAAVLCTIAFGIVMARAMGFRTFFGLLSGGSVGICGASAALAISAAFPHHPQKDRATSFAVISVSTLSTIAMVLYPMLTDWLGMTTQQAGVFLGGTIHDVAQVVGAGYSIGPQAGDTATLIKLMRVAMLLPVTLGAVWLTRVMSARSQWQSVAAPESGRPPLLPWFAVVFVLLGVLNSVLPLPVSLTDGGVGVSKILLMSAMAALGMKTHLKDVICVGLRPVLLVVMETLFLALFFYLVVLWWLPQYQLA